MSGLTWWATAKEGANIERLIHPVPWAALGWWWLEDVGNKSMFFTEIFMKKLKKFMVLLVWTLRTFCRGLLTYWICFFWCNLNMFIGNSWVTCWVWKIFQPDAPLRYQSSLMQQRNTRSFFLQNQFTLLMLLCQTPHVGWQRLVVKLSHACHLFWSLWGRLFWTGLWL